MGASCLEEDFAVFGGLVLRRVRVGRRGGQQHGGDVLADDQRDGEHKVQLRSLPA